ncbi:glycosyltransferase family 4 protein [Pseudomonas vancouverensis]|uniref:Glycosyltransferase family 1 protein n=1 Tax=Pseudomonas vancouverensis TaxID=95300 RepID=A0A1H2MQ63_PSEVA|nr:glycosyltransferase family 4 protein [Pseudomonas vancouverensis]KAB0494588.1 glycosyltransferase family 4 protein [Pseudomonas vancouverensis]TDB59254.1 glycosyltransferase family 1 protein [Pseudomonas vancouverensis]SDU95125.1 Glycosyltransferase involved in cell wall bisynthesis [Pseudomonas vancouverensis]
MKKIEVLHCAETIKGGIATYFRELLPLQVEALGEGSVGVVIPSSQESELSVPKGVRIFTFPTKNSRISNAFALALVVLKLLKTNQIGALHIHSTFAGASLRPLIKTLSRKVKLVYCPHGWAWDRPMTNRKRKITILVERLLSKFCDRIICISQHEKMLAVQAGISSNKISVVLNGIGDIASPSTTISRDWPIGARKLLFVGRFDQQKGADIFCEALRQLNQDACGVLVGDYVLGDAQKLSIPENVRHAGWLNAHELSDLYASADALVIPSRWEGFGLVATEAMRAGLPVIASEVGGLPEIVVHGKTGLLFKPHCANELIDAIRSLDEKSLLLMGRAGRLRFEELFLVQRTHQEIMNIYQDIKTA